MAHATTTIIRAEHAVLAALLQWMLATLELHRQAGTLPDFKTLRALLFYIGEMPEKHHHVNETEVLFAKLRARTPLSRELLDQLDDEHRRGEQRVRDLEHALTAFELMGPPRRAAFEQAARDYAAFYLAHMAMEERDILPLAERVLTPDDWARIDPVFIEHSDPLAHRGTVPDDRSLLAHLAGCMPAHGASD